MPRLPDSGELKVTDISGEFGGTVPHTFSEYYRGATPSLTTSNNTTVPTSGAISMSNFFDCIGEIHVTLSSHTTNFHCAHAFGSDWTSTVPKRLYINTGIIVGGTTGAAVTISASMGGSLTVHNSGNIQGYGGAAGGTGGNAIDALSTTNVTIENNSGATIVAGGGGGGAGGAGGAGGLGGDGGTGGTGGNGTYGVSVGASGSPPTQANYSSLGGYCISRGSHLNHTVACPAQKGTHTSCIGSYWTVTKYGQRV